MERSHSSLPYPQRALPVLLYAHLSAAAAKTLFSPMEVLRNVVTSRNVQDARLLQYRMHKYGYKGLWKGNMQILPRFVMLRGLSFAAFDVLRGGGMDVGVATPFVAGALAGIASAWVTYPFDVAHALSARKAPSAAMPLWGSFWSISTPYIAHCGILFGSFYTIKPLLPAQWRDHFFSDFALATSLSLVASAVLIPIETSSLLVGPPPDLVEKVLWGTHNQGSLIGARSGGVLQRFAVGPVGKRVLRNVLISQVVRSGLIFALVELGMRREERFPLSSTFLPLWRWE